MLRRHPEKQYLSLIKHIIKNGERKKLKQDLFVH